MPHLREEESVLTKQRQKEWRRVQEINNKEKAEARERFNGPVPLEIEIRREQRIAAHRRKWNTNLTKL